MSKRIVAKYKLDRRVGKNIWGTPKSPVNRRDYPPGQHGRNRRGRLSDYGLQLQAKQMLRRFYGNIMERQFRNIYREADRRRGDTSAILIELLESRLDAIVYRAGLAATVFSARQLVGHGCIRVNGKRVKIPSARVSPGDVVSVGEKWRESQPVQLGAESLRNRKVPDYIELHKKRPEAKFVHFPKIEEVPYGAQMQPNLVIEFYSR